MFMNSKESTMLKVCPACHGVYERQNLICPTCKKQLVLRQRRQTDSEPKDAISQIKELFIVLLTSHVIIDIIDDPFPTGAWIRLGIWLLGILLIALSGFLRWRRKATDKA